jgi:UDP-glucose 4-epimerase
VKKILITGVNGLLGRELVSCLLNDNENVIFGISRQNSIFQNENYHHIKLDLQSINFEQNIPEYFDVIIHLAQSDNFRDFPEKADSIFAVNVQSTQKLLDFALNSGCKKFIYTSSGGIYGNSEKYFTEEINVKLENELGYYLTSKLIGELLVKNYSSFFTTLIFRPFFIYGRGQKNHMLIPRLINSIKNFTPIKLNGNSGIKINPIHVSDAVSAIVNSLENTSSNIFNLAGNEILSLKEICEEIGEQLDIKPIFNYDNSNSNNLIGDTTKMKLFLWDSKVSFKQGVSNLISK